MEGRGARPADQALRVRNAKFMAAAFMAAVRDAVGAFLPGHSGDEEVWPDAVGAVMDDVFRFWPDHTSELRDILQACQHEGDTFALAAPHIAQYVLDRQGNCDEKDWLREWARAHLSLGQHGLDRRPRCVGKRQDVWDEGQALHHP